MDSIHNLPIGRPLHLQRWVIRLVYFVVPSQRKNMNKTGIKTIMVLVWLTAVCQGWESLCLSLCQTPSWCPPACRRLQRPPTQCSHTSCLRLPPPGQCDAAPPCSTHWSPYLINEKTHTFPQLNLFFKFCFSGWTPEFHFTWTMSNTLLTIPMHIVAIPIIMPTSQRWSSKPQVIIVPTVSFTTAMMSAS